MDNSATVSRINGDILTIIDLSEKLGWDTIREQSVSRILYLATVLYSFRYPSHSNPFSKDYHFSIDSTGPFYTLLNNAFAFLESNDYIMKHDKNTLTLAIINFLI